jgi:hypothetical protein
MGPLLVTAVEFLAAMVLEIVPDLKVQVLEEGIRPLTCHRAVGHLEQFRLQFWITDISIGVNGEIKSGQIPCI